MTRPMRAVLALADDEAVIAWWPTAGGDARDECVAVDGSALSSGDDRALVSAFAVLTRQAGGRAVELAVVLTSPWSTTAALTLPPLRAHEVAAIVQRDAARYFSRPRADVVTAVHPGAAPSTWIASDADGAVLAAIERAAARANTRVVRFTTAASAWAAAVPSARGRSFVVGEERTTIDSVRGRLTAVRRARADAAAVPSVDLVLAARHGWAARSPHLLTPALRDQIAMRVRRLTMRFVAVGVAALAGAAFVRWGAMQAELRSLEAARTALAPTVAPLLSRRDSLQAIDDAIATVARADAAAPRWLTRVAAVSAALPDDAWITAWRGAADSVAIEGRAANAAATIDALRRVAGVREVRATAPIALADVSSAAPERFSVVVRFTGGTP